VGIVDVDVGVDDDAMLVEPEPHIPDIPEVSSIPEAVDVPGGIDICDDVDVPGIVVGSVVAAVGSVPVAPDVAMLPVVAAVAGAAVPAAVPPPSKLALDPNVPEVDIPPVEHAVPPVVMAPLVGIAIVPVTLPVGAGLTPAELISVAPIGSPVVPTDPLVPIPSGEVAPSEGTAVSGSIGSSTWANAGPAHKDQAVATISNNLIDDSPIAAINQNLIGVLPLLIVSLALSANAEPGDWLASDALVLKCFQQPLTKNGWLASAVQLNTHLCSWLRFFGGWLQ
jgi:hypothetical protein